MRYLLIPLLLAAGLPGVAADARRPGVMMKTPARSVNADDHYQTFTFTIPGAFQSGLVDINGEGVVGGFYATDPEHFFTFTWFRGVIQNVPSNGPITIIPAITDNGKLFGNWGDSLHQTAGFFDPKTAAWTALPPFPGKPINIGNRMNQSGQAVGTACEGTIQASEKCVAWIWNGRAYQTFSVAPGFDTIPLAINDRGQVLAIVLVTPPFGFQSFLYDNGVVTPLVVNGGIAAAGQDLDNSGEVLMSAELDPNDFFRPILFRRGVVTELPLLPGTLQTFYAGMNERGDLVGQALLPGFAAELIVSLRK